MTLKPWTPVSFLICATCRSMTTGLSSHVHETQVLRCSTASSRHMIGVSSQQTRLVRVLCYPNLLSHCQSFANATITQWCLAMMQSPEHVTWPCDHVWFAPRPNSTGRSSRGKILGRLAAHPLSFWMTGTTCLYLPRQRWKMHAAL